MSDKKLVSNLRDDSCVIVAHRTLAPRGKTGDALAIPAKQLDKWLTEGGGSRLVDAGFVRIGAVPGPAVAFAAEPVAPTTLPPAMGEQGPTTFDGRPVSEATRTPEEIAAAEKEAEEKAKKEAEEVAKKEAEEKAKKEAEKPEKAAKKTAKKAD